MLPLNSDLIQKFLKVFPVNIFVYVDESGKFDEGFSGSKASVVGGTCSSYSASDWDELHKKHLEVFNRGQSLQNRFEYPAHYHCGELLENRLKVPTNAGMTERKMFTQSVFQNILDSSIFCFISKNRGKRFEYSPQATYVMNLIASLRLALEKLAELPDCDVTALSIVVAQRTIRETSQANSVSEYTSDMLKFVAGQLTVGEGQGVNLAKQLIRNGTLVLSSAIATRDAGLIGADFICSLARYGQKVTKGTQLYDCQPDKEHLLGDYQNHYKQHSFELLRNRYYGSCLEYLWRYFPYKEGLPDISNLITRLETEEDSDVLERELPSLLAVIHLLVKKRTEMPHALTCAAHIAECFIKIAKKQAATKSEKRLWINLHIQALAELVACHNHTGAVGPQAEVESQLTEMIKDNKKDSGFDAPQRKSFLLDIRIRNLNLLFNDYRFEDAYSLAEEIADERRTMIDEDEPDDLMGRILGSQGQACAFMGRLEPEWYVDAERLFIESLNHFAVGSLEERMSQNFLVTLYWQMKRFDDSFSAMPITLGWKPSSDPVKSITSWLLIPNQELRAFEMVNYLRLLSGMGVVSTMTNLPEACLAIEKAAYTFGTEHPYEQWWKWLGIIYMQMGDYDSAERCLVRSQEIFNNHGFTINTITNSTRLLQLNISYLKQNMDETQVLQKLFKNELEALSGNSAGFNGFIHVTGGSDYLLNLASSATPGTPGFWDLCTYLPFSYA